MIQEKGASTKYWRKNEDTKEQALQGIEPVLESASSTPYSDLRLVVKSRKATGIKWDLELWDTFVLRNRQVSQLARLQHEWDHEDHEWEQQYHPVTKSGFIQVLAEPASGRLVHPPIPRKNEVKKKCQENDSRKE